MVDVLHVGRNDRAGNFYYVMELADDTNVGQASSPLVMPASVPAVPYGNEPSGPRTAAGMPPEQAGKMPAPPIAPGTYVAKTLATELQSRGRLPVEECLRLAISLAEALAHLHKSGLVHRDIKPSNIIFVGGAPKLADIGLVADTAEARTFVGTEGFIPPEGPGTVQADIYSLGKVMYEMATGKDRQVFPKLPTRMGDGVDRTELQELNEVILKACDDACRRYETAEEMRRPRPQTLRSS